jgi:hypothetical protein
MLKIIYLKDYISKYIMLRFQISEEYKYKQPYPYAFQDNILEDTVATTIQQEILSIPEEAWDRYSNPFEDKYTLRDKYAFPPHLALLFKELESEKVLTELSRICGTRLIVDPTRNFWGVHKYHNGDKLDIHLDAEIHPITKQKKQLTLGIYLSSDWKEEYGCLFEIWRGDSILLEKVDSITPMFNRLILFTCQENSWHGNPVPVQSDAIRIFITMSYLSEEIMENKRMKALFIARPGDPEDPEKDRIRVLRADPEKYKEVYRM